MLHSLHLCCIRALGFLGLTISAHFLEQVIVAPVRWELYLINLLLQAWQTNSVLPLVLIGGFMAKSKNFIQEAIKPQNVGKLHESLGVPKGEKIPAKKIAKAAKAPGKLGQRARFAQTLAKIRNK